MPLTLPLPPLGTADRLFVEGFVAKAESSARFTVQTTGTEVVIEGQQSDLDRLASLARDAGLTVR